MPRARQVIIIKAAAPSAKTDDGLPALGSLDEIASVLARYNTGSDGSPKWRTGPIAMLYGPGFFLEVANSGDDVRQIMATMTDEDFAFPVLSRLCREQRWTLMDPETGRRFGP